LEIFPILCSVRVCLRSESAGIHWQDFSSSLFLKNFKTDGNTKVVCCKFKMKIQNETFSFCLLQNVFLSRKESEIVGLLKYLLDYRIIESPRLEKTHRITQSNHPPITNGHSSRTIIKNIFMQPF